MGVFEALKTFFSVLIKFFSVVLIMLVIAALSFEGVTYYLTGSLYDFRKNIETAVENNTSTETETVSTESEDSYNSIVFYADTDRNYFDVRLTLINTKTGYVDVLLLPSCSDISVSGSLLTTLKEKVDVSGNEVSLEEIYRSYGDDKYEMMAQVITEAFGVDFAAYDVMTESDMEELLAMADGVTITLKDDLTYRNQKNVLRILEVGDQQLNVKQAVAYMTYTNGTSSEEVNRMENITTYMTAYLEQALSQNSVKELYNKYKDLVETTGEREDDTLLSALDGLTIDGVSMRVLQGTEDNGAYTIDSQKAKLQISGLMTQAAAYSKDETSSGSSSSTDEDVEDSKEYNIELYNAGYISGLAGTWQDYLTEHGYTIIKLGNYDGSIETTEIVVTQEGMGQDFLKYFPNAEISVEEIDGDADIRIYLGTDSAYLVSGYEDTRPEGVVLDDEEDTESDSTEDTELTDTSEDDTEEIEDEY